MCSAILDRKTRMLMRTANDLTRASEEMQNAGQQGLRDASLFVNLGVLQVMKRNLPRAAQYAEEAIRLEPSNPQAQRLLLRVRAMPR